MAAEILIVAGEASSDLHASALVQALKERESGLHFWGIGGAGLKQQGVELVAGAENLNVVGGMDWQEKWSSVWKTYKDMKKAISTRRPRAAILLDLPDFNLQLAKHLHREGVPVIYYISPQVWAWRSYRVKKIQRYVDQMLVVFPFEKSFYEQRGVSVEFVGHPLLDTLLPRAQYRTQEEILKNPRVALLPGSRTSEVRYHAELLKNTALKVLSKHPEAVFKIPIASTLNKDWVRNYFKDAPFIELVEGDSHAVLTWSDVSIVSSGTATLETAVLGTPFCLFYVMSASSAFFTKHLIRYRGYFGMPNLLHGAEVVREFIQNRATPEALAAECSRLIEDSAYRQAVVESLTQCRSLLGRPGATQRVATQVLKFLKQRSDESLDLLPAYT